MSTIKVHVDAVPTFLLVGEDVKSAAMVVEFLSDKAGMLR